MLESITNSKVIKQKQLRNLLAVIVFFTLLLLACYALFMQHAPAAPQEKEETVHFETPLAHVDAQSIWMERAQHQLAQEAKASQALNQQLQLLQQSKETQDKTTQEQAQGLQSLQMQVEALQKELALRKSTGSKVCDNSADYSNESAISDFRIQLTPSTTESVTQ